MFTQSQDHRGMGGDTRESWDTWTGGSPHPRIIQRWGEILGNPGILFKAYIHCGTTGYLTHKLYTQYAMASDGSLFIGASASEPHSCRSNGEFCLLHDARTNLYRIFPECCFIHIHYLRKSRFQTENEIFVYMYMGGNSKMAVENKRCRGDGPSSSLLSSSGPEGEWL